MTKIAIVFFIVLVLAPAALAQRKEYACPMHPNVTSTRPGHCPKCGMELRLVKKKNTTALGTPAPTTAAGENSDSFSSAKIPDTQVVDQNGKQLNFYSDLIKGRTVAINFIFTTCTGICPSLTATFHRVEENAATRGVKVSLVSVSVDPTVDTPERLHEYAEKFKAGPNWTFVTGDKARIDAVLQALGVAVADKNDHTPMFLIGNDPSDYWTRVFGLSSPIRIVDIIEGAASRH